MTGSGRMKMKKKQKVGASMTDPQANLSVIGSFQIVEDAVTGLFGELGLDNITLKEKYNAAWVFAKNKIKVLGQIGWNEELNVECFLSSITRAAVNTDTAIRNKAGKLCVYSRAQLCMLDLAAERIRKVPEFDMGDGFATQKPEEDIAFARFQDRELFPTGQVRVNYTNIDFSRHTNNIEYIRFMLDTYTVRELEERPVKEMEISYTGQTYENDVLTIYRGSFGEKDIFTLQKEDKVVARSEIIF